MASSGVWQISITGLPEEAAGAVSEVLEPFFDSLVAIMEADDGNIWSVQGYAGEEPDRGQIKAALSAVSEAFGMKPFSWKIEKQAERDWLSENLAQFPAQRIGRFHVMGAHIEDRQPVGTIPLHMDATTAFGSGRHPTTQGCLLALQCLGRNVRSVALDMGCGSGILAIAYAKLFHRHVVASDMDPAAIAVTRAQACLNDVGPFVRELRADGFAHHEIRRAGPYGLIMANILARPLQRMAGDLVASLSPGGTAILSGFYERDLLWVASPYISRGMRIGETTVIDDWATLILSKP